MPRYDSSSPSGASGSGKPGGLGPGSSGASGPSVPSPGPAIVSSGPPRSRSFTAGYTPGERRESSGTSLWMISISVTRSYAPTSQARITWSPTRSREFGLAPGLVSKEAPPFNRRRELCADHAQHDRSSRAVPARAGRSPLRGEDALQRVAEAGAGGERRGAQRSVRGAPRRDQAARHEPRAGVRADRREPEGRAVPRHRRDQAGARRVHQGREALARGLRPVPDRRRGTRGALRDRGVYRAHHDGAGDGRGRRRRAPAREPQAGESSPREARKGRDAPLARARHRVERLRSGKVDEARPSPAAGLRRRRCEPPDHAAADGSAAITSSVSATQPNFIAKLRRVAACRSGAKLETASATIVVAYPWWNASRAVSSTQIWVTVPVTTSD